MMKRRTNGRIRRPQRRNLGLALLCVAAGLLLLPVIFVAGPADGQSRITNPIRGKKLYVDPNTQASKQAATWQRSRPSDAELMRRIASQPQAIWLGEWLPDIRRQSDALVDRIARTGALPVFVAYNIPHRDCGQYSSGGAGGAGDYRRWILDLARGIDGRESVVILEPDAIAALDCLPARLRQERYLLISEAAEVLERAGAHVYIDAGHARWQQPAEMADRLQSAGIGDATGFALNVSNFHTTAVNVAYGNRISAQVGGRHYIIDTSRNGSPAGVGTEWCNARNQALGHAPTTTPTYPLVDALLWVKTPGQSDGTCGGGPDAGQWWPDYALELSRMAETLGSLFPR